MTPNYDDLVEKYGDSPLSLGWGGKDRRELRFEVLTEPWDLSDASILDLGCGFGDLLGYLRAQGINVNYTGIDSSTKALDIARQKNPSGQFEKFDLAHFKSEKRSFDYVFASGIFNDKRPDSKNFLRSILNETKRVAKHGFSFNFLSTTAIIRYDENEYTSPSEITKMCEENLLRFQINHFYMPFEFTLHVSKMIQFDPNKVTFDDYFRIDKQESGEMF